MKRSFGMPTAPLLAGWASPRVSSPAFPLVDPLENMSSQDAAELDRLMAAAETKIDRAPRGPPSPFDAPTGEDAQLRQRKSPPRDATAAATYDAVDVLRKYFGYNSFRPGQAEAIDEAIEMRDVCVFWSSGSGKSLCYLLPALCTNKITLVVSPLISLMADQCNTINNTASNVAGRQLACFLGSGQSDNSIESRALAGEFLIVYITPEKLELFLPQLRRLHTHVREIGLLAVDEAHCISQWGHDFRVAYLEVGKFRLDSILSMVPIMALTATASQQVRLDINQRLNLAKCCKQFCTSVDRTNLHITVREIKAGGVNVNMQYVVDLLLADRAAQENGSTIIFVPTTSGVDKVADYLTRAFEMHGINVTSYHGKMSSEERASAHKEFLTGRCPVIVATVAFGMGIDKPDVRRIIHYGSPKCLEDYYQQIGRAGRDGLVSQCLLFHSDSELLAYGSGFYTEKLSRDAKKRHMDSIESMRQFANSSECRRVGILRYFQEEPPYSKCNTCDNCATNIKFESDTNRDFSEEFILIANTIYANFGKGIRTVLKEAVNSSSNDLKLKWGSNANLDRALSGLLPILEASGYVLSETKIMNDQSRSYITCRLTPRGSQWRSDYNNNRKICRTLELPVPPVVRVIEEEKRVQTDQLKAQLVADAVDLRWIPQNVLDDPEGEGKDWLKWHNSIKQDRLRGDELRAVAKENLLDRILLWRDTLAITLQMSPEAVLKGSLARRIAFAQVSSITDLAQIGLRVSETSLSELSNIISSSLVELKLLNSMPIRGNDQSMIFGAERSVAPVHQIMNATTIRGKNKPPVWEESFNKFRLGVSIDSIAVLHPKGIQVSTVIGHLLDAYKFGKPVDFSKLVEQSAKHGFGPPGKFEWDALESAAEQEGVNVLDGSSYSAKSLLSRVPEVSQLIILSNSTEEVQQSSAQSDRALISTWYSYVKWWHILKLTQSVVKFAEKEAITL